jgi:hypothetical protein
MAEVLPLGQIEKFMAEIFERDEHAQKAARLVQAILEAGSLRISDLAQAMRGTSPDANYKAIQRFLKEADPKQALLRLLDEEAPFYIGDVTEVERPYARRTGYVGRLSDGKTLGFWLLVLGQPYAGRTIPFAFVCYSEKTINQGLNSRNLEHQRLFRQVKDLLGGKPLVLDREFSYLGLFEALEASGIKYVIRLNGAHRPTITDEEGRRVALFIRPGQKVLRRNVIYLGKVKGNLAGYWAPGLEEPVWVFSNLEPEKALEIYRSRMKIEQSFRDLKGLLGLEKVMSKKLENLEKLIAFMLLAYAVGLLIGETIRDEVYRGKKAPGLLGAFYPPQAPAPAEAQAIFEAHPAGPGPVQGHRPRPCPISCLKVRSERLDRMRDLCYKRQQIPDRWSRSRMAFGSVVLSLIVIVLILRGLLRLGGANPVWEGTTLR